ncbi:MAG: hypothetical protein FWE40_08645 [Oscillospiraceae bacterium]|nr:hypothetical protein [Oscillospiraceae bacterium]
MNCPYCGNQGQAWHKNCTSCGAAYPENTAPQQQQPDQFAQPPQQQQPWGQPQQQQWQQPHQQPPVQQNNNNIGTVLGIVSIILGVLALTFPTPFIDVVFGIGGIVLAIIAGSKGARGLRIAGLIVSILGTLVAIAWTLSHI